MQSYSPGHIWWKWISNPRRILNLVQELLSEQKTVILAGDTIPWIDYMRNRIAGEAQNSWHSIKLDIDASSIGSQDIGEYLLHKICSTETVNNYRPGFGLSIETYLQENNVLHDKIIWIHNAAENQIVLWIDFFKRYKQRSFSDGLFLIECNELNQELNNNRIEVIDYSKRIDFYDVLSFSMMLVSGMDFDKTIKQYIAWATAFIFQNNIENLAKFINNITNEKRLKDSLLSFLSKNNISLDLAQLENYIWQAQMQIFFPVIEKHRTELIKKYNEQISKILKTENITWYDDKIENPYDAELGLLVNLTNKKVGSHKNSLYLDYSDYEMLHLLHESRNIIAHLGIIDDNSIEELLK